MQWNVSFVLTKEDLTIRKSNWPIKRPAVSHAIATLPCDVTVPTQGTDKKTFFQALGITREISRITTELLKRYV